MGSNRSEIAEQSVSLPRKAVRRRPGEPQREQKEATRKKLLDAARVIFENYPYNIASVDMIADQASVSRTTYYRHFDGKLPIALALFADLVPKLQGQWREILMHPDPQLEDVRSWLARQVETVEADKVLNSVLRQVEVVEPDVESHRRSYYEAILQMAWPTGLRDTPTGAELHARSMLLLLQMDQFLYLFGAREIGIDRQATINAMAKLFLDFLQVRKCEMDLRN